MISINKSRGVTKERDEGRADSYNTCLYLGIKSIRIEDVLYVPDLGRRLLSISALSVKGLNVAFCNNP